jgi:hypothetical protein
MFEYPCTTPGQQGLPFEERGCELEGCQPEGRLEHEVAAASRTKLWPPNSWGRITAVRGLPRAPRRRSGETRRRRARARAGHVLGDHSRVGDHLVLEARVQLHGPRLVDLLGRDEARVLLAAIRAHQAGELGRDPFLGHRQRRGHVQPELANAVGNRGPLLDFTGEVDRERARLRFLSPPVQGLRIDQLNLRHRPDATSNPKAVRPTSRS